jgi:hypothetical protein
MGLLATSQFHFIFPSVEVSQELNFSFNQMREGGDHRGSIVIVLVSMEKLDFASCLVLFIFSWDILDLSDFALSSSSLRIVSHLIF